MACTKCGANSCDGYASGCDVRTLQRELKNTREECDLWSHDVLAIAEALGLVQHVDNGERSIFPSADVMVEEIRRLRAIENERPKCGMCNGSGVVETGNNDLPCNCPAGDAALFNVTGVEGPISGALVKRRHTGEQ